MGVRRYAPRGDGQGLAAAACTIVQNAQALGQGQSGDDGLGRGILQVNQPRQIGAASLNFPGVFRDFQSGRRDGAGDCGDTIVPQGRLRRYEAGPQDIDPQKGRRAAAQGQHHRGKGVAKAVGKAGGQPIGAIERLQQAWHMTRFGGRQSRRGMGDAGEKLCRINRFGAQAAQDQAAPGIRAPKGRERPATAQRVIDQIADGMAVAGAGKTIGAAPVGQDLFGVGTAKDAVQTFDGGGKSGGRGHDFM